MKYIKKFENIKEYEVGDYVYISPAYLNDADNRLRPGQLIESKDYGWFVIMFLDGEEMLVSSHMIFTKLKPDKIEEFEFKRKLKKYNL